MFELTQIDVWFYGGIILMVLAVLGGIGCIVVYNITGTKIRTKLEKEYGRPQNNSRTL